MKKRKAGTLSGGSGKKVTSRKQAIAIGLSEAGQGEEGAEEGSEETEDRDKENGEEIEAIEML